MAHKSKKTNPSDPKTTKPTTPPDSTIITPGIKEFFQLGPYSPPSDSLKQFQIEQRKKWYDAGGAKPASPTKGTKSTLNKGGIIGRYDNGGTIQQLD